MTSLLLPTRAPAPQRPVTVRRRRVGGRLAIALVSGVIVLELLLRAIWGFGHPVLLMKDPDIGYLIQPNQDLRRLGRRVVINAYHQRSETITPRPAPGATRMLCLGDSVTFGTTLLDQAETMPALIQSGLRGRMSGAVEVLNASAGGWAPANELAYLNRFGTFGAQLVLLQIGSHDLVQPKSLPQGLGNDPTLPTRRPPSAIGEVWQRYVWPRLFRSGPETPRFPGRSPDAGPQCEANLGMLSAAFQLIRAQGARPVLVHTPNRDEVCGTGPERSDEYQPWRARLLRRAAQEEVPVINLCALWTSDPATRGYFLDEVHLTRAGAASAAAAVVQFLDTQGLLASGSPRSSAAPVAPGRDPAKEAR